LIAFCQRKSALAQEEHFLARNPAAGRDQQALDNIALILDLTLDTSLAAVYGRFDQHQVRLRGQVYIFHFFCKNTFFVKCVDLTPFHWYLRVN
jgi:hypothetical protein